MVSPDGGLGGDAPESSGRLVDVGTGGPGLKIPPEGGAGVPIGGIAVSCVLAEAAGGGGGSFFSPPVLGVTGGCPLGLVAAGVGIGVVVECEEL